MTEESTADNASTATDQSNSGIVITNGGPETAAEPSVEPEESEEKVEENQNEDSDSAEGSVSETHEGQPAPETEMEDGSESVEEDAEEGEPDVKAEAEASPDLAGEEVAPDTSPQDDPERRDEQSVETDEEVPAESEEAESVEEPELDEAEGVVDGADNSEDEVDSEATADAEQDDTEEVSEAAEEEGEPEVEVEAPSDVDHPPSTFEATIEAGELIHFIDSMGVLVEECKLRMSGEGLAVRAVDPANVAMVDGQLSAEGFESFDATPGVIGVDLTRFEPVLKLAGKKDIVTMDYDAETRKLRIECEGIEYTLALIDPASIRQEPDLPDLPLPCEMEMSSKQMDRAVKAADMVAEHIGFKTFAEAGNERLIIEADGDSDDVRFEMGEGDLDSASIGKDVKSLFSLEYLKEINKGLPTNSTIQMVLGDDMPTTISFETENGTQEITYLLAPRIQSD